MKILFICGSLEIGKDGVGDYTRRLGAELCRQGNTVSVIALNDHHIQDMFNNVQMVDDLEIPILRIPSMYSSNKQVTLAKQWITTFQPEWISLQFVPFSFHKIGLPISLTRNLKHIYEKAKLHIMFHELWVGMEVKSKKKHLFWGWIQRWLIRDMITKLNPRIIHTQTKLYQFYLAGLGANAEFIPLFSNIPRFNKAGSNIELTVDEKEINLVIFGSIHPGAPVDQFAKDIANFARTNNLQVSLQIVGRCGQEQFRWARIWQSYGLHVELLGEQSPERISEVLLKASIGISTTPFVLSEKSGSIAAMREHGLNVICVSKAWQPRGVNGFHELMDVAGIFEYGKVKLEDCLFNHQKIKSFNKVSEVSRQLADSFNSST